MKFRRVLFPALASLLVGCAPPVSPGGSVDQGASPAPQPSAATPVPSPSVSPVASPSGAPPIAAPFAPSAGTRLGVNELRAPSYAAFDPQQGFIYVADVVDPNVVTLRYQLLKFNAGGALVSKSALAVDTRPAPTRVDGVVANLGGLPIVNTRDDQRFQLVKVAGASVAAADRYPVNELPYSRLSASASAENGKYVVVAVIHRSADSNNAGPEYLSLGRSEEDKAPTLLYRMEDPLKATTRLAVAGDGRAFLAGPTADAKLKVVRVNADRSVAQLPIELPATPDVMALGSDDRLYMAWNAGSGAAKVRSVSQDGEWSAEGEFKLASGEYLTQVSSLSFDSAGRAVVTGAGFDAGNKSIKAAWLYSK